MDSIAVKSCANPTCPEPNPQPLERFNRNRRSKDGRRSRCKTCQAEQGVAYRSENSEKLAEAKHVYHRKNAPKILARVLAWQAANPEKTAERKRLWETVNPDKRAATLARFFLAHPKAQATYSRNRVARENNAQGSHTTAGVLAKLELQGGRCYYCPADLSVTGYHVDHKIPLARGGSNWPANICCACPGCNCRKRDTPFKQFLARARQQAGSSFGGLMCMQP